MTQIKTDYRHGFTLIELLVTISILMVVAVVVIPSIRMLNKDRKVHDTANAVGAVFSAARERAAVDGQAGVEIVPLGNNSGGYNAPNMGMALYQLRSIPAYTGDLSGSVATVDSIAGSTCDLLVPGDLSPIGANIQANDRIELNYSGVLYRILTVTPPVLPETRWTIQFLIGSHDPPPPLIGVPFKIYRQPVRIESSVVRLPRNLFLNLAWSGVGLTGSQLGLNNPLVTDPLNPGYNLSVKIWFNRDGSIDRVFDRDSATMLQADGPLYLLLSTGEGDDIDVTALGNQRFIEDDNNLWIVVDHRNGGVTLGRIAELGTAVTVAEKIRASRTLAKNRRSTTP